MEKITMSFQGKPQKFEVTFRCKEYIFCECKQNPAARGFFTAKYEAENKLTTKTNPKNYEQETTTVGRIGSLPVSM